MHRIAAIFDLQKILLLLSVITFLSSCATLNKLPPNEELLVKNNLVFETEKKFPNERQLKNELTTLFKQKPNEKWLGARVPLFLYYWVLKDKKEGNSENNLERAIRNMVRKRIAEPPALYNDSLCQATALSMKYYLQNRGYFEAEVYFDKSNDFVSTTSNDLYFNPKTDSKPSNTVETSYYINPSKRYLIDSTIFLSKDSAIQVILNKISNRTFLKKGAPVDGQLYDKEVNRVTSFLRNSGYAFFTPNYIAPLEGDTTGTKTTIWFEVLLLPGDKRHEKYSIGEIKINPHHDPTLPESYYQDTLINEITYEKEGDKELWVKPTTLEENVFLEKSHVFRQEALDKTNIQLSKLGVYRFVSIRQDKDSLDDKKLNYHILLSPKKKYSLNRNLDLNFTNNSGQLANSRVNLIGTTLAATLLSRNPSRGAELFSSTGSISTEINPKGFIDNDVDLIFSLDAKAQFDYFQPKFIDYLGAYRRLSKWNFLESNFYENIVENTPTKLSFLYNFINSTNRYNYHWGKLSFGYDFQNKNTRYIITHLGIDYLDPTIHDGFRSVYDSIPFFRKSFTDQLFTGFLLRDFSFYYNSRSNSFGESYHVELFSELSGSEIWLGNYIYNQATNRNDTFHFFNNLEYAQFAKFDLTLKYKRVLNSKNGIALRFNMGVARPFGYSEEVPYLKQFYVGGPLSIRGWRIREIGPGSYRDPLTSNPNSQLQYYQTGDFKLEVNAEYRFDMMRIYNFIIEGAIFVDAGNIWTFKPDERAGGNLQWRPSIDQDGNEIGDNFFKEFAIGTGYGFRIDFSYFLFRLDLGYPVKNNYKSFKNGKNTYWEIGRLKDISASKINFNLGLDYPF